MLAIVLAALTFAAFADQTGNANFAAVWGTVTNEAHQPLANVRVVAYGDVDLRETRTDKNGKYFFLALLPGVYRIHATSRCAREEVDALELSAGLEYRADVQVTRGCA